MALGKSVRLDFSHFHEGRNGLAGTPPLLTLRFTRAPCLAPLLLRASLRLLRYGGIVDRQLTGIDLLAQFEGSGAAISALLLCAVAPSAAQRPGQGELATVGIAHGPSRAALESGDEPGRYG